MKGKWKGLLLAFLTVILAFAMSMPAVAAAKPRLNKKKATLYVGGNVKLKVKGAKGKAKWSSSSKKVARVSKSGKVTAVRAGKSTIKARIGGKTLSCRITVKKPQLNTKYLILKIGESRKLKLNGGKIKSVSSSNKSVVSTAKNGMVTAKGMGSCKVTVVAKNGKKYVCTVLVLAGSDGNNPDNKKQPVPVSSLQFSAASYEVAVGGSVALPLTVSPVNASNRTVRWSTGDSRIATVSPDGIVSGAAEGSTTITATADDGSGATASCTIHVVGPVITKPEDVPRIPVLAAAGAREITIRSQDSGLFQIPEGSYTDAILIVDIPNGEIENKALFKEIRILAIAEHPTVSEHSFSEGGIGNLLKYMAEVASELFIEGGASTDVAMEPKSKAGRLSIVTDGTLSGLDLRKPSDVEIAGRKNRRIPVEASAESGGSSISTNKNLDITADAKLNIELDEGAERSAATITDKSNTPEVSGLGSVTVVDSSTGEVDTVLAENLKDHSVKMNVAGTASTRDGSAFSGLSVYLLKYRRIIDPDNISSSDLKNARLSETDVNGEYTFEDVPLGNYYLVAEHDGYMQYVDIMAVSRSETGTCDAEPVVMLTEAEGYASSFSGTIINSQTGTAVDFPVTLKLRKGRNNLSGEAKYETETTDGSYSFEDKIAAGTYTLQAYTKAAGYVSIIPTSVNVDIIGGRENAANIVVSPNLENGGMRFVLTWGEKPGDLDAHLVGPGEDGELFHIYSGEQRYPYDENAEAIASIDQDTTQGNGPETVTIHQIRPGVYSYFVYDYEDGEDEDSKNLSMQSDATVRVYDANGYTLRATLHVPDGFAGNLWHVCDYDADTDTLIMVNKVEYWPANCTNQIGTPVQEVLKENIAYLIDSLHYVCEEKLDPDSPEAEDIYALLEEAGALLEGNADVQTLREMYTQLNKKYEELNSMPDLSEKNKIDRAAKLMPGEPVTATADWENGSYFSFEPDADGQYTYLLRAVDSGSGHSVSLYQGYDELGYAWDNIYSGNDFPVACYQTTMEVGKKYTIHLTEYELESAQYKLAVIKDGSDVFTLLNRASMLKYDCEQSLKPTDKIYSKILDTIKEVNNLILNGSIVWDAEKGQELLTEIKTWQERLDDEQSNETKEEIDTATPLQMGMSANVSVEYGVPQYYSYEAESDGTCSFAVRTITPGADAYISLYAGYDDLYEDDFCWNDEYQYEIVSFAVKKGVKYTLRLCGYDPAAVNYEFILLEGDTVTKLYNELENVETLCERRLPRNSDLRVEIMEKIGDAWELLDQILKGKTAWDEADAQNLLTEMEAYYEDLLLREDNVPDDLDAQIDNAEPITLNTPVEATVTEEGAYYSFVPDTSGWYTFRAVAAGTWSDNPFDWLYREHESTGIDYDRSYSGNDDRIFLMRYELEEGTKYTMRLAVSEGNEQADYTLMVFPSRVACDLYRNADSVAYMAENRLEADDELRTKIQTALDDADELFDAAVWNEERAKSVNAELEVYYESLYDLPDLLEKNAVDGAIELTLNQEQSVVLNSEEGEQYYCFTPNKDGEYAFLVYSGSTDSELLIGSCYEEYDTCWDARSYGSYINAGVMAVAMKEGTKYTVGFREANYALSASEYTVRVVSDADGIIEGLYEAADYVQYEMEYSVGVDNDLKMEIRAVIDEAWDLLADWNAEKAQELTDTLYGYLLQIDMAAVAATDLAEPDAVLTIDLSGVLDAQEPGAAVTEDAVETESASEALILEPELTAEGFSEETPDAGAQEDPPETAPDAEVLETVTDAEALEAASDAEALETAADAETHSDAL